MPLPTPDAATMPLPSRGDLELCSPTLQPPCEFEAGPQVAAVVNSLHTGVMPYAGGLAREGIAAGLKGLSDCHIPLQSVGDLQRISF